MSRLNQLTEKVQQTYWCKPFFCRIREGSADYSPCDKVDSSYYHLFIPCKSCALDSQIVLKHVLEALCLG